MGAVGDAFSDGAGSAAPRAGEPELVCSTCGRRPDAAELPSARLTWSRGTERGRTGYTCDRCSRQSLRAIESKLDPAWW